MRDQALAFKCRYPPEDMRWERAKGVGVLISTRDCIDARRVHDAEAIVHARAGTAAPIGYWSRLGTHLAGMGTSQHDEYTQV